MVVLFSVDDGLYEGPSFFSFLLEDSHNDVHNLWDEGWETRENLFNDTLSHLLKHKVNILEKIESGFSEFLKLRLDQIDENVD
jgi:hypothetical protein